MENVGRSYSLYGIGAPWVLVFLVARVRPLEKRQLASRAPRNIPKSCTRLREIQCVPRNNPRFRKRLRATKETRCRSLAVSHGTECQRPRKSSFRSYRKPKADDKEEDGRGLLGMGAGSTREGQRDWESE
jgi:hypothetical protein